MKTITNMLVAVGLLGGCSQGVDISGDIGRTYLFTTDSEVLTPLMEQAANRWNAAGCMNINLDSGFGVPWTLVDRLDSPVPGKQAPGATLIDPVTKEVKYTHIHERAPHMLSSTLHEMAHAFGITEHGSGHGVFSNDPKHDEVIDEDSLSKVCEWVDCGCFNPEVQ